MSARPDRSATVISMPARSDASVKRPTLVACILGSGIVLLDDRVVNVALPTIRPRSAGWPRSSDRVDALVVAAIAEGVLYLVCAPSSAHAQGTTRAWLWIRVRSPIEMRLELLIEECEIARLHTRDSLGCRAPL